MIAEPHVRSECRWLHHNSDRGVQCACPVRYSEFRVLRREAGINPSDRTLGSVGDSYGTPHHPPPTNASNGLFNAEVARHLRQGVRYWRHARQPAHAGIRAQSPRMGGLVQSSPPSRAPKGAISRPPMRPKIAYLLSAILDQMPLAVHNSKPNAPPQTRSKDGSHLGFAVPCPAAARHSQVGINLSYWHNSRIRYDTRFVEQHLRSWRVTYDF